MLPLVPLPLVLPLALVLPALPYWRESPRSVLANESLLLLLLMMTTP